MTSVRYTDFKGEFIRYLYRDSLDSDAFIDFSALADENGINYEPRYISVIFSDLLRPGYIEAHRLLGLQGKSVGRLTGHGFEYIESLYKNDLPRKGPAVASGGNPVARELPQGRTFVGEVGAKLPLDARPGDMLFEYEAAQTPPAASAGIPASDRLVTVDHNKPEYLQIQSALDEAIELATRTRPNGLSGDEHATIMAGLRSARALWDAFRLSALQIEVGMILVIEQAQDWLKVTFEMSRGALLVEAIKLFFGLQ